jgi:hypothetical protein
MVMTAEFGGLPACNFRVNKPGKISNQNDKSRNQTDLSRAEAWIRSTHIDESGTHPTNTTEY